MILPPLTWLFYSYKSSQTVYVLQSVYEKPMEVYICSWFIILLLQICTSQTFCQRHNRPSKKKNKEGLLHFLDLPFRTSDAAHKVVPPWRGCPCPQTLQGHPSPRKTKFDFKLTQEKIKKKKKKSLFFKGFLFSLCPLTTSPFSHFRPPAARTHLSARSRTL